MTNSNIELVKQIKSTLKGSNLTNALDFATFLDANEMSFAENAVSYKNEVVCYMHLDENNEEPGPWTIWSEGDYSNEITNNLNKETAWSHINYCGSCGGDCSPGKLQTIFGKEFNNVCNAVMAFYIPNAETLEHVKELLIIRKKSIDNSA